MYISGCKKGGSPVPKTSCIDSNYEITIVTRNHIMGKIITLIVAVLALTVAKAAGAEEAPLDAIEARITLVDDIAAFKAANPQVELIPMEIARNARMQIVYTMGNRVSGDRLVASRQDGQSWSSLQDVTLILRYPQSGTGSVVSFVQVVVNQSSNQGQGYVVAGGIGQRFIQLVIEAFNTSFFNYNAQFYGY
ncbi:uncharacterized protein LOC129778033 [Toxorhynchites rutilus septentrionalis]|uniref:uncharacterized protein LOC129778033 n=1 Tax=Toxorhynchites rutilus septentrionalis TaxID=329112 RepID=UPI002478C904|nr:uncharacterized protein LOC129778033 [Toxorhynchites rutilus septentrionalis]